MLAVGNYRLGNRRKADDVCDRSGRLRSGGGNITSVSRHAERWGGGSLRRNSPRPIAERASNPGPSPTRASHGGSSAWRSSAPHGSRNSPFTDEETDAEVKRPNFWKMAPGLEPLKSRRVKYLQNGKTLQGQKTSTSLL